MLSGAHPLIVEDEFLIAMDIQRVLESAAAGPPVLARNYEEVAALGDRLPEFDLAIVTPPRLQSEDEAVAGRLLAAGVAVVVCSAARAHLAGTVLAGAEFVDKPFADEELLAACLRALEKRRR